MRQIRSMGGARAPVSRPGRGRPSRRILAHLLPLLLVTVSGFAPRAASAQEEVPGRILIELTPEAARGLQAGTLELPLPAGGEAMEPRLAPLFQSRRGRLSRFALLTFRPHREQDSRHPNRAWLDALRGSEAVRSASSDVVLALTALPDDPYFLGDGVPERQFHLYNPGGLSLEAVRAWPFVPADREVVVAVVDSGVDWNHPDLGGPSPPETGVIWINQAERSGQPGVDDDNNGFVDDVIGWDFVDVARDIPGEPVASGEDAIDPDPDPSDFAGHGTHVAGLVTALGNNGVGVAGIPGRVRIMPLRAGWLRSNGESVVYMSYCAMAIEYAALNGAQVINCSWRSANVDTTLGVALDFAIEDRDIVVVGSAGNDGLSNPPYQYLSQRLDCLAVAGIEETGTKAPGSNFGAWIDITGFYRGMASTVFEPYGVGPTYGKSPSGGTSLAAPMVSAQAALLRIVDPSATAETVRDVIKNTGRDLSDVEPVFADSLGGGLADFARAVQTLGGGWDAAEDAQGLTPLGETGFIPADFVFLGDDSLFAWGGESGSGVPGWETTGFPSAPTPGRAPLAVDWGGASPLVVWQDAGALHAADGSGSSPAGWPVMLPAGAGQPVASPGPSGSDVLFVPHGSDVLVIEKDTGGLPSTRSLGLAVHSLSVGQLDTDDAIEVAGVDTTAGMLRVWDGNDTGSPAVRMVPVGPVSTAPIMVELTTSGDGWVAVAGPDSMAPQSQQVLHFIGNGGTEHRTMPFAASPITALSAAGSAGMTRVWVTAVDDTGGVHLLDQESVRSAAAGGPVAGEILCADLNGDFESDILALRRDGTLVAWSGPLEYNLPGFPRILPAGAVEGPVIVDGTADRFVVLADTAGGLWSIPAGVSDRPAPWPAARGGSRRSGFLAHDRATPVKGRIRALHWRWSGQTGGTLCWEGAGLGEALRLRVICLGVSGPVWEGRGENRGCAEIDDARTGETLRLEALDHRGVWEGLAALTVPVRSGLAVRAPHPNPFRGATRLSWSGAREGVRIQIFDVRGRLVLETLGGGETGSFDWTGSDGRGRAVPPGLYFFRVSDGGPPLVQRVLRTP